MGIDAGLFDRKSKKYCWFDRLYNLDPNYCAKREYYVRLNDIFLKLYTRISVPSFEVELLIDSLLKYADGNKRFNLENLKKFYIDYPSGDFFISTDADDTFELVHEDGYEEITY